jgi:hypothetical protein
MQKSATQACTIAAALAILTAAAPSPSGATVFHTRDEMLELAFPDADTVKARDYFLDTQQHDDIERLAMARLDSDLLTVYEAHRDGHVLGYAILDIHVVRTFPEAFLVVLSPEGIVSATHILAFHEPVEYMPSRRWLALLQDRSLADELRLGHDIVGVTGSTLSGQAVLRGVRRALAIHAVLLAGSD